MATDLVELLSRLSLPTAPLPNYLDQTFTENAVRRAPQAIAFVPPPVVPLPQPATFFIGFGGAWEDACGFAASATVTGDDGSFCNCTTFTGAIFAAASTGTWYVSDGSQYVSVSITNGNPVATVTSACSACVTTTTTSTTTTTTTLDCAQTGSAFPTSSLDCVLTGSVIINVDPPPTTTTTTTTSTTTTTTTLCPIDCALTGSARASTLNNCSLTGSVYPIPIPPPPPTTTTTSTTTTTTTVPPTTTTSTTTSTTTPPPTTTTSTTTSTTTALSVWYQLTNCADSSTGYSQEYPFGTFAISDRVTSPGITWVVTGTQLVDPGGTLYALTATGFTNCPTTTTTSTTTSTTTAEPTTTTSTTTSTTTAEPTTTTSTTTSTTTATPTTTSTTTSTTTAPVYSYGLGVDSVSGANACTDFSISPVTYYSAAAALADGVVLYQDSALTTVAPDNYYSDGISNWLIVSGNGILTNETSCPI